jgi:ABC-type antimicrobial peptide transport system permease subunit
VWKPETIGGVRHTIGCAAAPLAASGGTGTVCAMMGDSRRSGAVSSLVAHGLRSRWQGWLALALLTAVAGGAVLAAVAGAIRTDTAYPRYLAWSNASDLLIAPAGQGFHGYFQAVAALPQVAASGTVAGIQAEPLAADGSVLNIANVNVAVDGKYGRTVDAVKLLAGRLPRPDDPREVTVDQTGARELGLHVGSTLRLGAQYGMGQRPLVIAEHVVGIMVTRGSAVPVTLQDRLSEIVASAALLRELGPQYLGYDGIGVKLRPGASVDDVTKAVNALALTPRFHETGGQLYIADEDAQAATIERAIRPQAVALILFALALAVTALLIVGQVATRVLQAAAADHGVLAALGMTRRQLLAASLAEVAVATLGGAALAVAVAVAASPLTPIGPARLIEPSPGVSVNAGLLGIGFAAIVTLLLARVAIPAWRSASARPAFDGPGASAAGHRPGVASWLAGAGAPVSVATGVRFALHRGGRGAVPVRSAVAGAILAIAAVAGAVTFSANLQDLVTTPRLYGQDWDAAADLQFATFTDRDFTQAAASVPGLAAWTYGVHGALGIGKDLIPAIGLAPGQGPLLSPTVLAGRAPRGPGEIVLGTSVLREHGLQVGQRVTVTLGSQPRALRIVGSAVFPSFGQGSFTPTDIGLGAETTASFLATQVPPNAVPGAPPEKGPWYNFALVRFAPGTSHAAGVAALTRALHSTCTQSGQQTCVLADQRPNTVANYASIDATPAVLAAVLAVLALGVLGQFLLSSARRRRRDLAVLKVLGMLRAQLASVAAWQAGTVTAIALALGLPLGIAGGHWAWAAFASAAGLSATAVTPLPVLWMIPAALAAAALIALRPGWSAARLRPAIVLRAE